MRMIALFLLAVELMAQTLETPLERFYKRIGYQSNISKLASNGIENNVAQAGMIGAWPDMRSIPGLENGWNVTAHAEDCGDNIIFYRWSLSNGVGQILVKISHGMDSDRAKQRFLQEAGGSLGVPRFQGEIPYTACSNRIGKLSATSIDTRASGDTFFYNYNVFVCIHATPGINRESIAEWLNDYLEAKVVLDTRPYIPAPRRVVITPANVRVGNEFEISLDMPFDKKTGQYFWCDSLGKGVEKWVDQFEVVGGRGETRNSLRVVFRAKKAGKGTYRYAVVDRRTSLFYTGEVSIDVAP